MHSFQKRVFKLKRHLNKKAQLTLYKRTSWEFRNPYIMEEYHINFSGDTGMRVNNSLCLRIYRFPLSTMPVPDINTVNNTCIRFVVRFRFKSLV